mmetsp:Transcript_30163/g.66099  ORF Transcript_30163/g.66099 Transcript_30163/m.66099 type:complete len:243 (+) Transcript_30163:835-1563(+)
MCSKWARCAVRSHVEDTLAVHRVPAVLFDAVAAAGKNGWLDTVRLKEHGLTRDGVAACLVPARLLLQCGEDASHHTVRVLLLRVHRLRRLLLRVMREEREGEHHASAVVVLLVGERLDHRADVGEDGGVAGVVHLLQDGEVLVDAKGFARVRLLGLRGVDWEEPVHRHGYIRAEVGILLVELRASRVTHGATAVRHDKGVRVAAAIEEDHHSRAVWPSGRWQRRDGRARHSEYGRRGARELW